MDSIITFLVFERNMMDKNVMIPGEVRKAKFFLIMSSRFDIVFFALRSTQVVTRPMTPEIVA